jgi:RES domain-containing protein
MLEPAQLRTALSGLTATRITGPFSRAVGFRYMAGSLAPAPPTPLWGIGSVRNGGRYNPRGSFEVIYLAEDAVTALAEVQSVFTSTAGVKARANPWVLVTVDGSLRVLDLTADSVVARLSTSHSELTGEWRLTQARRKEAPTQLLGRAAYESKRFDAIRFPSSKHSEGICVAVFPDLLDDRSGSFIEVYDTDGLLHQRIPPV